MEEIVEVIKNNISSSKFYSFYKKRKERVKRINGLLHQSSDTKLRNFMIHSGEYPSLSSMDSMNISFIIDIMKDKRGEPDTVQYVAKLVNAPIQEIGRIAYFMFPHNNPPVAGLIKERIKNYDDYLSWLKLAKNLVPGIINDYIMLESALLYRNELITNNKQLNYKEFENINHRHITDIERLKNLLKKLNKEERKKIVNSISNSYVKNVIKSKRTYEVIIDGSNIIYSGEDFPDITKIDMLFTNTLSKIKTTFFPYRIIFDANIRYLVKGFQQEELEKWLALPQTELYSPADERILQLADEKNASVISYDRFLEYDTSGIKTYRPEDLYEG
ncbi:MAG: hypothetical protein U9O65_08405 [Thermotogota bacterium]|nr:hypothetical protein [Thermotogota bacterium]